MDFLFGRGPCRWAENKEEEVECQVNEILYQQIGMVQPSATTKAHAIEQGKLALGCMATIGGVDLESQLALLGPFGFIKNLVYEQYYNSIDDDEKVARLCQIAEKRRQLVDQRRLRLNEPRGGEVEKQAKFLRSKSGTRRLGTAASVDYPSSMSSSYGSWVSTRYLEYLPNGDTTKRASIDMLTENLLDPISTLQDEILADTLAVTEAVVEVVCNVLGSFEAGFDPGDACRIISSSINLAIVSNDVAMEAMQFDLMMISAHNLLIDEAEMQATHADTAAMVAAAR